MVCPLLLGDQNATERKQSLLPDTFIQLADGKLNGQKAFMTGALKVKGNVMLAVRIQPFTIPSTSLYVMCYSQIDYRG